MNKKIWWKTKKEEFFHSLKQLNLCASDYIDISMKIISRIRKENSRRIVSLREKWLLLPEKKRPRKEDKKFRCSDTHKIIIIRNLIYDFYIENKSKLLLI